MEQTGGKWMSLIGAYMIVKGIVNLILGFSIPFSVGNIVTLLISGVLAFLIIKGVPYMNYVTGAYLALMSVIHIIPNIQGHHWFYLAEGIIDLIAAVVLFTSGRTKES